MLWKSKLAKRMMAWFVELLKYEIHYESKGIIWAQSLADFLNEFHPPLP